MDTFTLFIELGYNLLCRNGNMAYIVPISLTSSDSLAGIHNLLLSKCDDIHISSYSVRPQPVFKNAMVNTSILLFRKTSTTCKYLYSTKMYRKGRNFNLQSLVDNLEFIDVKDLVLYGRIPKISLPIEQSILRKLFRYPKISTYIDNDTGSPIYYRTTGGRYFKVVTNYSTGSTKEKNPPLRFKIIYADALGSILSSNLSFWFYQIYSNNLDWKSYEINEFRIPELTKNNIVDLHDLYSEYLEDIESHAKIKKSTGESKYNVSSFKEYKIGKSKSIIDKIDDLICPLYGLTKEETNFIKNYDIEFRLSDEE